jgi:S1-C subfamily serine protease
MVLLVRLGDSAWRPLGIMRGVSTQISAPAPAGPVQIASGSGVFVNAAGVVLTAAHVTNSCKAILVKAYNAAPASAVLEAVDPKNDLALLRTRAGYGEPAVFRSANKPVRLGESIGVVGYPLAGMLSSEPKATFGQINSVAGMNNDYTLLQISAPVQPGNSGGPVFDEDGLVLGLVVSQASPAFLMSRLGTIPQNVNFAVRGELAQIFMTAHGVGFATRRFAIRLDTADVAEAGAKSTAAILCLKS